MRKLIPFPFWLIFDLMNDFDFFFPGFALPVIGVIVESGFANVEDGILPFFALPLPMPWSRPVW